MTSRKPTPEQLAAWKKREAWKDRVAKMPSLHLLVWPTPSCVRLSLVVYHSKPGARRSCTVLRSAEWRPQEVSEVKLVEWGMRAMADWLEAPTIEHVTMGAWPLP